MHGVGPGSLLGGRYLVQRRVSQHARYERWSAADQTLARDVVLLCFETDSPVASAVLDAARRAAGIEDPRLVRVLDVHRSKDERLAFVVEEPVPGAQSMAWILGEGALPAEEVRRVVGEAASALESARLRGLHHLMLTPRSVLRLDDGAVKVRGLATEAALAEAEESDSQATRADTVALVSLGYAGLTGRWPLDGPDSGLEAAAQVAGGVAAPSELAAGVPTDLDLLIRRTLNEDSGPRTPAELIEDLGPWSLTPVAGAAGPIGAPGGPGGGSPTVPSPDTGPSSQGPNAGPQSPGPPDTRGSQRTGAATAARVGTSASPAAAGGPRPSARPAAYVGSVSTMEGRADAGDDHAGQEPAEGTSSTLVAGAAGATKAVGNGVRVAAAAAGGLATSVGTKFGSAMRNAADRAAEKSAERAERRNTEQADPYEDYEGYGDHIRLSDTLVSTDEELEPPVPPIAGAPSMERLDGDQSRIALLIVAVFVVLAAVLGVWGLPRLSGIGDVAGDAPVVTRTVTGTATATAAAPSPSSAAAPVAAPVTIVGASQYDPENGGVQPSQTAVLAYDGNPQTAWRSSKWYATPDFGGFQKQGLGLMLDLGKVTDVHKVAFTTVGASDLTVYVAGQPQIKGATPIGAVTGLNGNATVAVPDNGAVKGQYVFLFFTKLGPDGEGHYRAQIAEATVS